MRADRLISGLLVLLVSIVASAAGAADPANPMPEAPEMKILTDDEVKRYVATLGDIVATGIEAEKELGLGAAGSESTLQGLEYSQKMQGIIERHGFDPESFSSVHGNVMLAYAALEMARHQPEIEEARKQQAAQMAQMKAQLSPAQYEAMMQGMAGMNAMVDVYQDVPPVNKKLVEKYRAQLDKILDESGR